MHFYRFSDNAKVKIIQIKVAEFVNATFEIIEENVDENSNNRKIKQLSCKWKIWQVWWTFCSRSAYESCY